MKSPGETPRMPDGSPLSKLPPKLSISSGVPHLDKLFGNGGLEAGTAVVIFAKSKLATELCHTLAVTCQLGGGSPGNDVNGARCRYLYQYSFQLDRSRLSEVAYQKGLNGSSVLENVFCKDILSDSKGKSRQRVFNIIDAMKDFKMALIMMMYGSFPPKSKELIFKQELKKLKDLLTPPPRWKNTNLLNKRVAVVVVVDVFGYYALDEDIYAGIREVVIEPNSELGITKVLKVYISDLGDNLRRCQVMETSRFPELEAIFAVTENGGIFEPPVDLCYDQSLVVTEDEKGVQSAPCCFNCLVMDKGISTKYVKKLQFDQRLAAISEVAYSHPIKVSKWTEADQATAARLIVAARKLVISSESEPPLWNHIKPGTEESILPIDIEKSDPNDLQSSSQILPDLPTDRAETTSKNFVLPTELQELLQNLQNDLKESKQEQKRQASELQRINKRLQGLQNDYDDIKVYMWDVWKALQIEPNQEDDSEETQGEGPAGKKQKLDCAPNSSVSLGNGASTETFPSASAPLNSDIMEEIVGTSEDLQGNCEPDDDPRK